MRLYFIALISLFVIGCGAVIPPEPGNMTVLLPTIDPQATARPTIQMPRIEGSNPRGEVEESPRYGLALGFDAISPIYEPSFIPAAQAQLAGDDLVIGIAWGGEAKAYPVRVLNFREMVNDQLAGIPTLVTW